MKTSVLISSFAALCLLITFAESPMRRFADNNTNPDSYSYFPASTKQFTAIPENTADMPAVSSVSDNTLKIHDLSYLKFSVSDYMEPVSANPGEAVDLPENSDFGYLKFNVAEYSNETATEDSDLGYLKFNAADYSETDASLPEEPDYSYLKFNVADYSPEATSEEPDLSFLKFKVADYSTETPSEEPDFSFLKFNVADYSTETASEVPDFSFLKFNVADYSNSTASEESDLSYLKFNVNVFVGDSELSKGEFEELPESETATGDKAGISSIGQLQYIKFDVRNYCQ